MGSFVVLAIALAAVALGAVVVTGRLLFQHVRALTAATRAVSGRVQPLVDDLTAELAVLQTEVEAVQAAVARGGIRPEARSEPLY